MAKKTASTIECLLNKKVEPIRGKWYTKEETGILDHQPVQGKMDNPEEWNKECSSTSDVVDTLKTQDPEQMCNCENILVIVDKKSPKRPRRQPVTRNKNFLWTELARGERNSRNKIGTMKPYLSVLHQNIQSIGNKQIEVDLPLKLNLNNIDILCFTEHWLKEDYLKLIHLDQYKLVIYFSRKNHNHGVSCTYVKKKKNVCTKDLNCSQDISVEKDSEVSMTELVDYGYIIVCIYRSTDGNFWIFLKNLELII